MYSPAIVRPLLRLLSMENLKFPELCRKLAHQERNFAPETIKQLNMARTYKYQSIKNAIAKMDIFI